MSVYNNFLFPFPHFFLQRRGGREAAEAMDVGGGDAGDGGEEDIVVDDQPLPPSQIPSSSSARNDSLAFNSNEKLLSLEQAILTSIDRCREFRCGLIFVVKGL